MLDITINETNYTLNDDWGTISLKHFIIYMEEIDPEQPELLQELLDRQYDKQEHFWKLASVQEQALVLPFIIKKLAHFSSVPIDVLEQCNKNHVFQLYWMLESGLSKFDYNKKFHQFTLQRQVFYLPKKHMSDATVIEFIDAAQFQKQVEGLEAGQWECLPRVMCILCKKKGEKYADHNKFFDKKAGRGLTREELFLNFCTMDIALNVVFFLMKLSAKLSLRSQISSLPTLMVKRLLALRKVERTRTDGTVPL